MMDFVCRMIVVMLDWGIKFIILLALFKFCNMDLMWEVVNDVMDVVVGCVVIFGLCNFLVWVY